MYRFPYRWQQVRVPAVTACQSMVGFGVGCGLVVRMVSNVPCCFLPWLILCEFLPKSFGRKREWIRYISIAIMELCIVSWLVVLVQLNFHRVWTFNLESRLPVIKIGDVRGSYFGYSVAQHQTVDEITNKTDNWWVYTQKKHSLRCSISSGNAAWLLSRRGPWSPQNVF
jgi:hypothetical protein